MMGVLVAAPLHVIWCGRIGEDTREIQDGAGNSKMVFIGTKMKAEGDTLYMADLVVRFEQASRDNVGVTDARKIKRLTDPHKIVHLAIVEKARNSTLQGETLVNPEFEDFAPFTDMMQKPQPLPVAAPAPSQPAAPKAAAHSPAPTAPAAGPSPAFMLDFATEKRDLSECSTLDALRKIWTAREAAWKQGFSEAQFGELRADANTYRERLKAEAGGKP
jgi:hypothetical protein